MGLQLWDQAKVVKKYLEAELGNLGRGILGLRFVIVGEQFEIRVSYH